MAKGYKLLIVEDEFPIVLDIEQCLLNASIFHSIDHVDSFENCVDFLARTKVDVILMDVNINGSKNGIELARWVYERYQTPVVFLTAFSDDHTFQQIMELDSFGYIIKPFKEKELIHTLKIALRNSELLQALREQEAATLSTEKTTYQLEDSLFIRDKGKIYSVPIKEVDFIEGLDNYIQIYCKDKKWIVHICLKDILSKLPSEFVRVHRSYIIPIFKIEKIEDQYVFIHQKPIPIGKSFKNDFFSKLNIL